MVEVGRGRRKREEERERVKRERRREKKKWKRERRRPMYFTFQYITRLARDAYVRAFAARGDSRRAMLVISRVSRLRKISFSRRVAKGCGCYNREA